MSARSILAALAPTLALTVPANDRMLVHGGEDSVWALSLTPPETWSALVPAGGPPLSRLFHAGVFDPDDARMVIYGGRSGTALLDDAWELRLGSEVSVPPLSIPAALQLRVAPNPVTGPLHLTMSLPNGSPARLELWDLAGRRVLKREIGVPGSGLRPLRIDETSRLPAGVYLLRLTQEHRSMTRRFALVR